MHPRIDSISPDRGCTGGGELVRIVGASFAARVEVRFAEHPSDVVSVRDEGGVSIADVRTPPHDEATVDVSVQNLAPDGAPIAGELATLEHVYRFERPRLTDESDLTRLIRTLLVMLKRDLLANTTMRVSVDYADERHVDGMRVVPIASLPALVLAVTSLPENRTYSTNELREEVVDGPGGPEIARWSPPLTVDLDLQLTGSSNSTTELLNLVSAVAGFFNGTKGIEMLRDPAHPEHGTVRWELALAGPFRKQLDGPDGIGAFTVDLVVRGFDLDPGAPLERGARVQEDRLSVRGTRL